MAIQALNILLVEGNEGDVVLLTEALRDSEIVKSIITAGDGSEAINLLSNLANITPDALPDLILLANILPQKNDFEVIAFVKRNALLQKIPLITLTTASELENSKAENLEAYCYLIKPIELEGYENAVRKIEDFWLSTHKHPKPEYNAKR